MDNKIIINPVDSQTFELQEYSVSQSALIQTDIVDTAFTLSVTGVSKPKSIKFWLTLLPKSLSFL